MNKTYIEHFQKMIQKETITISDPDGDWEKFREFDELLKELFPTVFETCEVDEYRGSVLLKWKGKDQSLKPYIFMGHMDVVEANGPWIEPPFSGNIRDGKIYGRGTLDNKLDLWAIMEAAEGLMKQGYIPDRDIYLESSCTEECTGAGAEYFAGLMKERGIQFEICFDEGGMIVKDPIPGAFGTFAMTAMGEKGSATIRFKAYGKGGHASAPGRNTPLVRLGKFMAKVEEDDPFESRISPVISEMFTRLAPYMGNAGKLIRHHKVLSPLIRKMAPELSPTIGALLKTTLAFTVAKGSDADNVIPELAYVDGNMRFSHHQGFQSSVDALKPLCDKYDIEMEILREGQTSGLTSPDSDAFKLVEEAVSAIFPEVDAVVPYVMTGASDARFFSDISDACIRFLPFTIDSEQLASVHGLNECLDIDTLDRAVEYYQYLMKQ